MNRYSYEAPEESLRIAGTHGILPRLSEIKVPRHIPDESEHSRAGRLERPERQGRFHDSAFSRREDLPPQKRPSLAVNTSQTDTRPFTTVSTPNPLKVRKISKTSIPPSKQVFSKNDETTSKPDSVFNHHAGPSIPRKLQLNTSLATRLRLQGKSLLSDSESLEISPMTTSVNGKNVMSTAPISATQTLPSARSGFRGNEGSVTGPAPDSAKSDKPSLDTRSPGPLPANSDAMDVADSPMDSFLDSRNASQSATEASTNGPQMKDSVDKQDVDMLDASAMGNVDVDDYIKKVFPEVFKMDFEKMAAVTIHGRTKTANCFYLYFPEEAGEDFQILEKYLDSHLAIVLSNRKPNDWEKFTKSQSGVALV